MGVSKYIKVLNPAIVQVYGNSLYSIISQSIDNSYLLLNDVPEFVDIDNHVFNLQYSGSFSGAPHMSEDNLPHVTLEHALNEVFFLCTITVVYLQLA